MSHDDPPVVYASQSNAWVNVALFTEWFHHKFVSTVQAKLREIGCEPKAVLLLDNCSAHPDEEDLVSTDGKVTAKYLPPNVTSLIQPMDQGVLVSNADIIEDFLKNLFFKTAMAYPLSTF